MHPLFSSFVYDQTPFGIGGLVKVDPFPQDMRNGFIAGTRRP
jgi:hypothetical protein